MRCGFHRSTHIIMHKFQKLRNRYCLIFWKDVLCCLRSMQTSHTWCNGTSFKFMPLTIVSNFLRLAILRWSSLWCQSRAPSFENFATFTLSFPTLTLRKYIFISLRVSTTTVPWELFTLQPYLSNSTFKPSKMNLVNKNETIFHFGNMKNLNHGCKQQFTSNLHCGLDVAFTNGLQNGVICHVHPSWNNGFISGEPFSFKYHVLCYAEINDLIVRRMIISTQGGNKHLFLIFTSLVCLSFSSLFFLKQILTKCLGFYN